MMSANTRFLWVAGTLLLLLAWASVAQGTIYYVDGAKGNDSFPGIFPHLAFKTIAKATSVANSGDTIIVEARMSGAPANAMEVITQPALFAEILVDGRAVTPIGETSSTTDAGDGLSFSYTTR